MNDDHQQLLPVVPLYILVCHNLISPLTPACRARLSFFFLGYNRAIFGQHKQIHCGTQHFGGVRHATGYVLLPPRSFAPHTRLLLLFGLVHVFGPFVTSMIFYLFRSNNNFSSPPVLNVSVSVRLFPPFPNGKEREKIK